ncbi:Crp/Fnr family transcriptional regulator [Marinomonas sp. RS-M-Aa-14]|uniref:Crp/Fnr family transcriptional regulator n=1 Tax=Marinomonas sp. RS-M-Aa-14 TaxID=3241169 RepID=UPI003AAC47D3
MDRTQLQNSFEAYFNEFGYDIDWQRLTVPMDVHVIRKGDYLFKQGDTANRLYFLHSGLVRYVSVSDEGKEFTQTFAKSPEDHWLDQGDGDRNTCFVWYSSLGGLHDVFLSLAGFLCPNAS